MATGILSDVISTSDISDLARTRQQKDETGDWDKEDESEPTHKGQKITGSIEGKGKGSLGTLFNGNRDTVEELEKFINDDLDSHFDDEVSVSSYQNLPLPRQVKVQNPASLEVRKKERIAASARKRAAERKSRTSPSLSPASARKRAAERKSRTSLSLSPEKTKRSSSESESREAKWSFYGDGLSESHLDLCYDDNTSISINPKPKNSSRRIRSANGNMKSPPTPSGDTLKLKLSSSRHGRRSPGKQSRRERKEVGLALPSLEPPLQSAAENVELVPILLQSLSSVSAPDYTQIKKEEIANLSQSTQSTHVESAHSRDSRGDDLHLNADATDGDADIEEVAMDHDRKQKTETAFSQPTESPDASSKRKSARIPYNDLSKLLLEDQSPTPEIALDESSMPSLDISTLQAEAAMIRANAFEKQHIAKTAGGFTRIDGTHPSTKKGERDEERPGLRSISSLDSSKLEDSSYAIEELLPVDSPSEARWHPVVERDSLKSSARRNDEKATHPQHETEKRRKGRPTLGETLAHGKKNALNISAHSGDSSMHESSKMEEGPVVMIPVLQKSRWLPAVDEEHDATQLRTADTVIISSKRQLDSHTSGQQFDSDDDEVAEDQKLEPASDSSSKKRVAHSTLKKEAMIYVAYNGNLNNSDPPTDKSVARVRVQANGEDKSELASPHVNTTTDSSECYESEMESSNDDKDEKVARRDTQPNDSDVHVLQSMPANNFNSPSTVGGPGPQQGDNSPSGRSMRSVQSQSPSHSTRLLRQKVNSRRELLTSMLQATTKKTHSTENELLDLKRKLALSQTLVQQLELENAQIRRQAVVDVARVQMIVQTKRHNHETELESQMKELIIERSAAVQESHELRMIIMDSCTACQSRLPDREFEMDDSIRRTIMGRRSGRRSSAFEWLAGSLSEEALDIEETSSAASRVLNSKGRRFRDESDTYSLSSTLPETGSNATSNLPTFGEAPLHWLSSKILKKGGPEKDDISESDPPMIERVITYSTESADANGDEHKSPSPVHDHGQDSANSVETSDTGNASSDPKPLASASVPMKACTSDAKSVEGHLAAGKKNGGSFASNGSVSGEQTSESKLDLGQVPQPAEGKTKEKETAGKGRFSFFGRLMAEQVENDIPLLPNAAGVKVTVQDKPENGICKDSDNGKGGKKASGSNVGHKGSTGVANRRGKLGSPDIKLGAVQRETDSVPAPWHTALGDSMGSLS
jgi:hypothetical protein